MSRAPFYSQLQGMSVAPPPHSQPVLWLFTLPGTVTMAVVLWVMDVKLTQGCSAQAPDVCDLISWD